MTRGLAHKVCHRCRSALPVTRCFTDTQASSTVYCKSCALHTYGAEEPDKGFVLRFKQRAAAPCIQCSRVLMTHRKGSASQRPAPLLYGVQTSRGTGDIHPLWCSKACVVASPFGSCAKSVKPCSMEGCMAPYMKKDIGLCKRHNHAAAPPPPRPQECTKCHAEGMQTVYTLSPKVVGCGRRGQTSPTHCLHCIPQENVQEGSFRRCVGTSTCTGCGQEKGENRIAFGTKDGFPLFCAACKEDPPAVRSVVYTNVRYVVGDPTRQTTKRKCIAAACTIEPSFGINGERACCASHKEEYIHSKRRRGEVIAMEDIVCNNGASRCECGEHQPSYGIEVGAPPRWCRSCPGKPDTAVLVRGTFCGHCDQHVQATFRLAGTTARWTHCGPCATMDGREFESRSSKCNVEGCSVSATWSNTGSRPATHCATHGQALLGPESGRVYCHSKCSHKGCTQNAIYTVVPTGKAPRQWLCHFGGIKELIAPALRAEDKYFTDDVAWYDTKEAMVAEHGIDGRTLPCVCAAHGEERPSGTSLWPMDTRVCATCVRLHLTGNTPPSLVEHMKERAAVENARSSLSLFASGTPVRACFSIDSRVRPSWCGLHAPEGAFSRAPQRKCAGDETCSVVPHFTKDKTVYMCGAHAKLQDDAELWYSSARVPCSCGSGLGVRFGPPRLREGIFYRSGSVRCSRCKLARDVDLTEKRCIVCQTVQTKTGLCDGCSGGTGRLKLDELRVKALLSTSPELSGFTYNPSLDGTPHRPDFMWTSPTGGPAVILEVDENGHAANSHQHEWRRMQAIGGALHPTDVIFIRYNPHAEPWCPRIEAMTDVSMINSTPATDMEQHLITLTKAALQGRVEDNVRPVSDNVAAVFLGYSSFLLTQRTITPTMMLAGPAALVEAQRMARVEYEKLVTHLPASIKVQHTCQHEECDNHVRVAAGQGGLATSCLMHSQEEIGQLQLCSCSHCLPADYICLKDSMKMCWMCMQARRSTMLDVRTMQPTTKCHLCNSAGKNYGIRHNRGAAPRRFCQQCAEWVTQAWEGFSAVSHRDQGLAKRVAGDAIKQSLLAVEGWNPAAAPKCRVRANPDCMSSVQGKKTARNVRHTETGLQFKWVCSSPECMAKVAEAEGIHLVEEP